MTASKERPENFYEYQEFAKEILNIANREGRVGTPIEAITVYLREKFGDLVETERKRCAAVAAMHECKPRANGVFVRGSCDCATSIRDAIMGEDAETPQES